ncbi:anthranilate phosphoribosyltransferase [Terricaulis silvestris]|uniref:Anthranilate phosphoribosyltransferase n=1 Tax=Terricaulis silvestris TaxID=2686094 RepID=A0A6I6MVK0_9CAUL|nr:anthranilate phosphoribosyltransferase [Terricaulis silvestris]QGZ95193.1 Anthranilate phosphoribosyltransferase [Terricaulis silvestris]
MSLAATLSALKDGGYVQSSEIDGAFSEIMDGVASHDDIKQFLTLTMPLMNAPPLIAAGARALRSRMVRVAAPEGAIDVCGTGGDGAHTLNISTAVAFVVAGCGVPVAKHGNRAMSSRSGAADVLEALGVKLTGDVPTLERCLREAGLAFLFAQNHHLAMRHVALARRELGKRTIFNLLGPLSNPAGVKRQLMGVFSVDFLEPVAGALKELGCEKAWVVHGAGGLDELSAQGSDANTVAILDAGAVTMVRATRDAEINPDIRGGLAAENAEEMMALLNGGGRPGHRDAVALNAAGALVVAGKAKDVPEGWPMALKSIDSGAARGALANLIAVSQSAP